MNRSRSVRHTLRRWCGALAAGCSLLLSLQAHAQVELQGIRCELTPFVGASTFSVPVGGGPAGTWILDQNGFGNIVSNRDPGFEALPPGRWRHTGVDFAFMGPGASLGQAIHAVGPGVVVFATGSAGQRAVRTGDGRDMTPTRGGVVIVAHVAPHGMLFDLPARAQGLDRGVRAAIPALRLRYLYSYYLHLDPQMIWVRAGDYVWAETALGRLYAENSGFAYPPHLHFELWSACSGIERNGYDRAGTEFNADIDDPVIDPSVLWRRVPLVRDPAFPPYASEAGFIGVPPPSIPLSVSRILDRALPGWAVPGWIDRRDYRICVRGRDRSGARTYGTHPYFVSGDFDGDGHIDHAVSLSKPGYGGRRTLAIVIVRASGSVEILDDSSIGLDDADGGILIGMTRSGTTIPNLHGEPVFLRTDAVDAVYCEKSSQSYVYDPGARLFRQVWTSD